jgi:hypothetical protein
MAQKTKMIVDYDCGHTRQFEEQHPYKGDCVLCPVCDQAVTVIAVKKIVITRNEVYVSPWEEEVTLVR